jgi:hypothetical protein
MLAGLLKNHAGHKVLHIYTEQTNLCAGRSFFKGTARNRLPISNFLSDQRLTKRLNTCKTAVGEGVGFPIPICWLSIPMKVFVYPYPKSVDITHRARVIHWINSCIQRLCMLCLFQQLAHMHRPPGAY